MPQLWTDHDPSAPSSTARSAARTAFLTRSLSADIRADDPAAASLSMLGPFLEFCRRIEMGDTILSYLISLGIISAGVVWIVAGTIYTASNLDRLVADGVHDEIDR
jgi:hypothetical protein